MREGVRIKDWHELQFWKQADKAYHKAKLYQYLEAWGVPLSVNLGSVLEIGTGMQSGFLGIITANRKIGIDPLYGKFRELGLMEEYPGIQYVTGYFDEWDVDEKFDWILSADALDHGEMGFQLLPKIASMLNPGGRFCLHVHLRPQEKLNVTHDHSLNQVQLDHWLGKTNLIEVRRTIYPNDIDGQFCEAVMGVWRKP